MGGNHTYDEKVLPDGSVVKINRTTFHNTDEDGNGFVFHSSVHHVVSDDRNFAEETEDDASDEVTIEESKEKDGEEIKKEEQDSEETKNDIDINEEENGNGKTENEEFVPLSEKNNFDDKIEKETTVLDLDKVDEEENEID